eukprot:3602478-Rhodomonas_salina.1
MRQVLALPHCGEIVLQPFCERASVDERRRAAGQHGRRHNAPAARIRIQRRQERQVSKPHCPASGTLQWRPAPEPSFGCGWLPLFWR